MSFKKKLIEIVNREWTLFGSQEYNHLGRLIKEGKREWEPGFWERVETYWKKIGKQNVTGKTRSMPWSAVGVSSVFLWAGSKEIKTAAHCVYIRAGFRSEKLVTRRIEDYKPKPGDIICYARTSMSFDDILTTEWFPSHGDIVVHKTENYIHAIGANVGDSWSKVKYKIDENGYLVQSSKKPLLCIIQNLIR